MTWQLGQYIEDILEKKGGKRAGWNQLRLAERSNISPGHIGYIIHGEAPGKKGPPNITIDTLIALSKGLGVPEYELIAAYKGEKPQQPSAETQVLGSVQSFIQSLPVEWLTSRLDPKDLAMAFLQHDGPEKFKELVEEARRRMGE
jgi:transcriptional regulator with XRE-family HTH domain